MLVATPPELTNAAEATFRFTADRPGASFLCSLDQGELAACASPYGLTVADGTHSIRILAVDSAGQRSSSSASFSWTVDTTGPTTTI